MLTKINIMSFQIAHDFNITYIYNVVKFRGCRANGVGDRGQLDRRTDGRDQYNTPAAPTGIKQIWPRVQDLDEVLYTVL